MNTNDKRRDNSRSVLGALRALAPHRAVTFAEALRVAELQAARLLQLWDVQDGPVPDELVSELPRIQVIRAALPASGSSHWSGSDWIITLNADEPWVRRRFTLMHEFKHIVDHGQAERLYADNHRHTAAQQAELVADYFAGCVLLPRRLLKRAWGQGLQTPAKLARAFAVSPRAAEVRLSQVGLTELRQRCGERQVPLQPEGTRPQTSSPRYFRSPPPLTPARNLP